jgi:hypothetical protein
MRRGRRRWRRRRGHNSRFLHEHLFGAEHLGKLVAEPLAGIDGVELHVTEGIARAPPGRGRCISATMLSTPAPSLMKRFTLSDAIHDGLEAGASAARSSCHLGHVHAVHGQVVAAEAEPGGNKFLHRGAAGTRGGGGGEPAAVAAHHFVDDEHARVGVVLGDDVAEEARALLGGGPGAEALADGIHVVVDGLGQADDGELVVVPFARKAARSAAVVLVSSPPMVWSTSTRRARVGRRRPSAGSCPSLTRPRFRQSLTLVSLTRLLPIGLPPWRRRMPAAARSAGPILMLSPSRRPL